MTHRKAEDVFDEGVDLDSPIELVYSDGEKLTLPSIRQLFDQQEALLEEAQPLIDTLLKDWSK